MRGVRLAGGMRKLRVDWGECAEGLGRGGEGGRLVGREGSWGRSRGQRSPSPSKPRRGVRCLGCPRHCSEPGGEAVCNWEVFRNSQGWRRNRDAIPKSLPVCSTRAPALKGEGGKTESRPGVAARGKRKKKSPISLVSLLEPHCKRHWPFCYIFLKHS